MSLVTDVPARVLVYSNIYGLLFYMRSYRNVRIGDDDSEDPRLCVMEYKALKSFCQGLVHAAGAAVHIVPHGGWSPSRRHQNILLFIILWYD